MSDEISKPPQHPFEVTIRIGGDDWVYVLRTIKELSYHLEDHGPECSLSSGGGGGSHYVEIHKRDVTPEQFHEELHAWCEKRREERVSATEFHVSV